MTTDLVKQSDNTKCSCGQELKGFAVDIGCVYETEFPDEIDLMAVDSNDAGNFCDGYSTVHDVIAFAILFSEGNDVRQQKVEGLHDKVPSVEVSNSPRHPYFFREKPKAN